MPQATRFEFTSYRIEPKKKKATFCYSIKFSNRPELVFQEELFFPKKFETSQLLAGLVDAALQNVHLALGVSYYKLYCPRKIILNQPISEEQARFWETVYQKGLGEFFFQNNIDPSELVKFPSSKKVAFKAISFQPQERALLGIGGGKDSIVATELLRKGGKKVTALVVETQKPSPIIRTVIDKLGLSSLTIKRRLDEKLFASHEGAYNGHIPFSAVVAFLGELAAILYDYSYVIVGNEASSNQGNVRYHGLDVNHQWSKSVEFESLFQRYTHKYISPNITYFSILRPFHEIRIAQMFARYKKYFPYFSSCNRNFRVNKDRPGSLWCGECAKCVFVFVLLSAFLKKKELLGIFGRNLYEDKKLMPMFQDVLGFGKMKPFDCVGTFEEAQAAFYFASPKYSDSWMVRRLLKKIKQPKKLVEKVLRTDDTPSMPAYFRLLGMEKVCILGYGKEGKMTRQYLKKQFPKLKVVIADKQTDEKYLERQAEVDLVIKTPGIPKDLVTAPYLTATNLFFSQCRNLTIGVTGSKGKSTTSALIYSILKEAGKKVSFLGNNGSPMLGALMRPVAKDEIFVIELSSYQLDDIVHSPRIAVILNFFPDHMNYHGTEEKYYQAKMNITNFQTGNEFIIYHSRNHRLKERVRQGSAQAVVYDRIKYQCDCTTNLKGRHNQENIKAAMAVAQILKIPPKIVKRAITKFQPLPHRLELVGQYRGISFIDDAISTTPESTIMAIKTIPCIKTILLGGQDRGYDFAQLEKQVRKYGIKNIVLFPETGKRMFKSRQGLNVLETSSMEEAVAFAYEHTPAGCACVLSTASPSYSVWKNFEEKGDQFKYWVRKYSKTFGNNKRESNL